MRAEERGAKEEGFDAAGVCNEHLLLLGEEGEALAEGEVRWLEGAMGLEDLRKEPVIPPPNTHTTTSHNTVYTAHACTV